MGVQKRTTKTGKIRWIATWRTPDGRQHSRSFDTKKSATTFLADKTLRLSKNLPDVDSKITVRELYDEWLYSSPRRPRTVRAWKTVKNNHIVPLLDYPAAEVTRRDVTELYQQLCEGRPWAGGKFVSVTTARQALGALRGAYWWGIERRLVEHNLNRHGFLAAFR